MLINELGDDVRGGKSHNSMPSVNSRLQVLRGKHISGGGGGGKFDAFLNVFFCILSVFLGWGIWDSVGEITLRYATAWWSFIRAYKFYASTWQTPIEKIQQHTYLSSVVRIVKCGVGVNQGILSVPSFPP